MFNNAFNLGDEISKIIDEEISFLVKSAEENANKILTKHLRGYKCTLFFGPSENVLKRYYKASKKFKAQNILRITADCPLVDPVLIDKIIKYHHQNSSDYTSNTIHSTFPNGQDIEIFKTKILIKYFGSFLLFFGLFLRVLGIR